MHIANCCLYCLLGQSADPVEQPFQGGPTVGYRIQRKYGQPLYQRIQALDQLVNQLLE